tara:strand:+ start:10759 stop:11394 length:636 start_codon:yes stop_codon:yes gene_type:complete
MDVGFTQYIDTLGYSSIRLISSSPRVIEVRGTDFRKVSKVLINGIECPSLDVVSDTMLLAEIPIEVTAVNKLAILSSSPTATKEATSVELGLFDRVQKATGMAALIQRVIKILFTTPGTNAVEPSQGVGLQGYFGSNKADLGSATSLISSLVESAEFYIKSDINYNKLPKSEQLSSIEVNSIVWDRENQTLSIDLKITAADGNSSISQLEV